jgi:hypothetical protein
MPLYEGFFSGCRLPAARGWWPKLVASAHDGHGRSLGIVRAVWTAFVGRRSPAAVLSVVLP